MLTITCDPQEIPIVLPPCATTVQTAWLSSRGCHMTSLPLDVEVIEGGVRLSGIGADLPDGVWDLHLQTECGCFVANVALKRCAAPEFVSTHTPTSESPPYKVCCDEE